MEKMKLDENGDWILDFSGVKTWFSNVVKLHIKKPSYLIIPFWKWKSRRRLAKFADEFDIVCIKCVNHDGWEKTITYLDSNKVEKELIITPSLKTPDHYFEDLDALL